MDDQFPKDEDSSKIDYEVSPESGLGQEALGFNAMARKDKFLGGSETTKEQLKSEENQGLEAAESGWLGRLKEKFKQGFIKEQPKEPIKEQTIEQPKVSVDIFYSPHATPKDKQGLRESFLKADIYFPEHIGWSKDIEDTYRNVSLGILEPRDALDRLKITENNVFYSVFLDELSMVYGSGKPIGFIDIPEGNKLVSRYRETLRKSAVLSIFVSPFDRTFDQLCKDMRDENKNFGEMQKEREDYMASQIRPKILEIINSNPDLKNKSDLKALVSLGDVHTALYHQLKREGDYDVDRTINTRYFGFGEEVARRAIFGKEIDDTLIARAIAERLFAGTLKRNPMMRLVTSNELRTIYRKIFSGFSSDEVKDLVDQFSGERQRINKAFKSKEQADGESMRALGNLFDSKFKEKGINPLWFETREGIDKLLAMPMPRSNVAKE